MKKLIIAILVVLLVPCLFSCETEENTDAVIERNNYEFFDVVNMINEGNFEEAINRIETVYSNVSYDESSKGFNKANLLRMYYEKQELYDDAANVALEYMKLNNYLDMPDAKLSEDINYRSAMGWIADLYDKLSTNKKKEITSYIDKDVLRNYASNTTASSVVDTKTTDSDLAHSESSTVTSIETRYESSFATETDFYKEEFTEEVSESSILVESDPKEETLLDPINLLDGWGIVGTEVTNFSNGFAVVPVNTNSQLAYTAKNSILYGIDSNGSVKVELHKYVLNDYTFCNGLVSVYDYETEKLKYLDDKGKIISADDLGASEFVYTSDIKANYDLMFNEGYIVANRITSSFEGTCYETAIYDSNFEIKCDYSEELYDILIDDNQKYISVYYMLGYITWEEYNDGELTIGVCDIENDTIKRYSEAEYEIYSDTMYDDKVISIGDCLNYGIYTGVELVADLGLGNYSTLNGLYYIDDEHFLVTFQDEENNSYFTVTDGVGTFNFEPLKFADCSINKSGYDYGVRIYCSENHIVTVRYTDSVCNEYGRKISLKYAITAYDFLGKEISKIEYVRKYNSLYPEYFEISINNEAIMISDIDTVTYYDFELNLLCKY